MTSQDITNPTSTSHTSTTNDHNNNNHADPTIQHTSSNIAREELLRVIIQSLQHLNYNESASLLQTESGVRAYDPQIEIFRHNVLTGKWNLVNDSLHVLQIDNEKTLKKIRYLIYKQQYLELLEKNNPTEALKILRDFLTPNSEDKNTLHRLASLLLFDSKEELYRRAYWDGSEGTSRSQLINSIYEYVDSSLLLPENRLETLLVQAVNYQKENLILDIPSDAKKTLTPSTSSDLSILHKETTPQQVVPSKLLHILDNHNDEIWSVKFSPDGKYLASCGAGSEIHIHSVHDNFSLYTTWKIHQSDPIPVVAWSPNSRYLLAISQERKLKVFDISSDKSIFSAEDCTTACGWFPNSEEFFVAGGVNDKFLTKWNIKTNTCEKYNMLTPIHDIAISSDGTRLVLVGRSKKVSVHYPLDLTTMFTLSESEYVTCVTLSPCGKFALFNISSEQSTSNQARVHLWNLETRKQVHQYSGHTQSKFVFPVIFGGQNSCFIISGSEDCYTYVWKRSDENLLLKISGHTASVCSVSCHPSNTLLVTGSDDHTMRVYGLPDSSESEEKMVDVENM